MTPGTRLGPYEVLALLGAGGMGEVYRAKDPTLKREVALKVLPADVAKDRERLARFQREAEVLASLNHPHIAQIYGLEHAGETFALVMELVEGEDLAQRIARGPIPLDEALPIARQIADALEAAHEKGIVHRDLKPANIKLRPDGAVKVLDFGLAKALEPSPSASHDARNSPTITTPAVTEAGLILGTAAYMSPEQARGKPVDKRADIWAFGCVLYEMLTGDAPFRGGTVAETLAEVIKAEPAWDALPADVPPRIRAALRSCLEKSPARRLRDIGDAWLALDGAFETTTFSQGDSGGKPRRTRPIAFAIVTFVLVAAAGAYVFEPSRDAHMVRFTIDPPAGLTFQGTAPAVASSTGSISPDGRRIVFPARDASGAVQLWMRELDALTSRPLPGTENAAYQFWSADGQSVAFFSNGKLHRVDLSGGPSRVLADAPSGRGGTWSRAGVILFASGPVHSVPAAGGQAVEVTRLSPGQGQHASPVWLPDQTHFLFFVPPHNSDGGSGVGGAIHVGDATSGETRRLTDANSRAVYASPGYLLFIRNGTLLAQPFDAKTLTLSGESVPLASDVAWDTLLGGFSVSQSGVLIYRLGPGPSDAETYQLAWIDATGNPAQRVGEQVRYAGLALSPDGSRLAYHRHDGDGGDVWLLDMASGASSRLTFGPAEDNSSPVWSPDGSRIVFASQRTGKWGLYVRRADGAGIEELLFQGDAQVVPMSWSPDSRSIVYQLRDRQDRGDLAVWSLPARKSAPLLQTNANEEYAEISPDGRWITYQSDETGRPEVYVRSFPGLVGRWQVSTAGGYYPRWRADGGELFFFDGHRGTLRAAAVEPASSVAFRYSPPRPLFNTGYAFAAIGTAAHTAGPFRFAPAPDGRRFLLPQPSAGQFGSASPIVVVLNWTAALERSR